MQALQSNSTLARMDLSEADVGVAALAIARAMQEKQAGRLRLPAPSAESMNLMLDSVLWLACLAAGSSRQWRAGGLRRVPPPRGAPEANAGLQSTCDACDGCFAHVSHTIARAST